MVNNDTEVARVLLDKGADPNIVAMGTTPFLLAAGVNPYGGRGGGGGAAAVPNTEFLDVMIAHGADVNAAAAMDANGLNGHPPLFHTVNANGNRSAPVMELLLEAGARADVRLAGITWGRGFDWETTCFDVTPVSYAQLGLLPQMHRDERHVYANVRRLLQAAHRPVPPLPNVPNSYLAGGA